MPLEELRVALAVAGIGVSAFYDVSNNRNVPNWLSYSLVGIALAINFYAFQPDFFLQAVLVAGIVFAAGFLLYREGQIGGADVLAFTAISLLLPKAPEIFLGTQPELAFGIPFIFSVFAYSGALFLLVFSIGKIPVAWNALKRGMGVGGANAALALAAVVFFLVFWNAVNSFGFSQAYLAVVFAVVACALFLSVFKEPIIDSMIEWVPLKKIDEEDVLATDKLEQSVVKKFGLKRLLTAGELVRLKKIPLKKFPVLKKLPSFLPFVLAGLLIALKYGDAITLLAKIALEGSS